MQFTVNARGILAGVNQRRAFTLVELLVVIGIIAMLISLLMPALSRARDASLAAQCMSNLRQQGIAEQMYLSDSGGAFITPYQLSPKFSFVNHPYVFEYLPMLYQSAGAQTWRCPVDNFYDSFSGAIDRIGYPEPVNGTADIAYSYALNFDLPGIGHQIYRGPGLIPYQYFNPWLGAKVTASAKTALLLETWSSAGLDHRTPTDYFRFNHIKNTAMNVLFLDGHVESMTPKQILPGQPFTDTTQWPEGFSAFWFGQEGAIDQLIY
jgi:prepilin-type N-terminal cleavage/methylation domain-containing protein/prepilin-type processing-associated H-X9-DG protein